MELPKTISEALEQGYEFIGETWDNTGKSRDWQGEERREGAVCLAKYGPSHKFRHDGQEEDLRVKGDVLHEFVIPYTATLNFGEPRPVRKGENF